jgi:hypothetical protein
MDTDPSPASVYSVFERLDELTPLVATEYSYSGVGALVGALLAGRDASWPQGFIGTMQQASA